MHNRPTVDNAPWLPHGPRPPEADLDKSWPPYWPEILGKAIVFLFGLAGLLALLVAVALAIR